MAVCFTGHRTIEGQYFNPDNMVGNWYHVLIKTIQIVHRLWQEGHTEFISGGALGFDQVAARAVLHNRNHQLPIKLIMALPFLGFEGKWFGESKVQLAKLVEQADHAFYVCEPEYAAWKMQKRNEWMVDNSIKTVAMYLPDKLGGTLNCISYAMRKHRPLLTLHPLTRDVVKYEYNTDTNEYGAFTTDMGGDGL